MRVMPLALWLGRHFDLRGAAADGNGFNAPVPYGVDVAPDGAVWFSQLNDHRIGRVDPDDFGIEMIDTPFTGPRRLRFDARGALWIPGFSSGVVARFDPATREFRNSRCRPSRAAAAHTVRAQRAPAERPDLDLRHRRATR